MKITAVRCVEVTGTIDDPEVHWDDRLIRPIDVYPRFRHEPVEHSRSVAGATMPVRAVFVHVETDAGVYGIGGPIGAETSFLVARTLAPLLIGEDPLAHERLWDIMYRATVMHGRKGIGMLAMSAVDCALWDLKGRHFDVPVWALLGGPTRDRLPAYASTLGASVDPDRAGERAERLADSGFQGMKWFPRYGPADGRAGMARNTELVRSIRAGAGDAVDVMIDAWMSWDVRYTLEFAARAEEWGLRWIEEPVLPDRTDSYVEIVRRLSSAVAIAGGEHEYTRWGIHDLVRAGAVHVAQPEALWAGGLTELLKIAVLCSLYGVELVPHGQSMQVNAHFSFAQPAAAVAMIECLVKWNLHEQWFLANPVTPQEGWVYPPEGPGLGMELDDAKVERRRELAF